MARSTAGAAAAARATLEGWRPPVSAALQPVVLLDADLGLVAASTAARRLLGIGRACRELSAAEQLVALAADPVSWESLPCVLAVRTGAPQTGELKLPKGPVDVVASPLFGPTGVIGATVFLTAR